MIQSRLHQIFDAYVERFDELNSKENREFMKWEAAEAFSTFDFNSAENFVPRLKELAKTCSVVIDTRSVYPLSALIQCAGKNSEQAEKVRNLFLFLFEEDSGDLTARQGRIDTFIKEANALAKGAGLGGYSYENTQTSVMAYLALHKPEENYLLSTSKAKELAARVGFVDDWGTLSGFQLDTYYRFCEELAKELSAYEPIMTANKSRFAPDFAEKHNIPDLLPIYKQNDINLLVFDIIYCASRDTYGLGNVCPIDPKLEQNITEALKRQDVLHAALAEKDKLALAEEYWKVNLVQGSEVTHKVFGKGNVTSIETKGNFTYINAEFPAQGKKMRIWLEDTKLSNFVSFPYPEYDTLGKEYLALIAKRNTIEKNVESAAAAFEPYKSYI